MKNYMRCFVVGVFLFMYSSIVQCNTSESVFAKYPNKFFVETGSYMGYGIEMALNVGFPIVYSVELSPHYFQYCVFKFRKQRNVHLLFGDSAKVLPVILQKITVPATFWLDGHWCGKDNGDTEKGDTCTPLLAELDAIQQHPIKTHTILIDDVRCFGKDIFDFISKETIIKKLLEINPHYTIGYENGLEKNDVLVAHP